MPKIIASLPLTNQPEDILGTDGTNVIVTANKIWRKYRSGRLPDGKGEPMSIMRTDQSLNEWMLS
jgi:hypothetical protein